MEEETTELFVIKSLRSGFFEKYIPEEDKYAHWVSDPNKAKQYPSEISAQVDITSIWGYFPSWFSIMNLKNI